MFAFLLLLHDAGPRFRLTCQSLAAALRPGDHVVVVDAGSDDETVLRLRQFLTEAGWGDGISQEVLALPAAPEKAAEDWIALARTRIEGRWCIPLGGQDLVDAIAMEQLRGIMPAQPDNETLILANRDWWLAGSRSLLPWPDAERWPDPPPTDPDTARAAALRLLPDPMRLIHTPAFAAVPGGLSVSGFPDPDLSAAWDSYETAITRASKLLFCPQPIIHTPWRRFNPGSHLRAARARLGNLSPDGNGLEAVLEQMDRLLILLEPQDAINFLNDLREALKAMSRRLRLRACAHDSATGRLLADLRTGGVVMAMPHLMAQFAARDRQLLMALGNELAQLREDVDLALPGPDYLMAHYDWVRRP